MRDGRRLHVSLVAIPDAMASTLSGIYDALNCFDLLASLDNALPSANPFHAEIVAPRRQQLRTASGLPVSVHRAIDEVGRTDIVVIPSMMVEDGEWKPGRYPGVVDWLREMQAGGAMLCRRVPGCCCSPRRAC